MGKSTSLLTSLVRDVDSWNFYDKMMPKFGGASEAIVMSTPGLIEIFG